MKVQLKFKMTAVKDFKIVDGMVRLDVSEVNDIVLIHKDGAETDDIPSVVIDNVTVTPQ